MEIYGKSCVVSGASSGIGLETVKLLSKAGARVLAVARKLDELERIALPGVVCFAADLSSAKAVDAVFARALELHGGIDLFIANAGFAYCERSDAPDWARAEGIFGLNVVSVIYAFQKLRALKGGEPFHFAVTASAVSFLPMPGYASYCATKAAVHQFLEAARYELSKGQRISCLYPVATRTKFFERAASSVVPWPTQDAPEVAAALLRGIRANRAHIYPFAAFPLLRAAFNLLPAVGRAWMRAQWKRSGLADAAQR